MKLIYQGSGVINGVPARDLEAVDIKAIAEEWGKSTTEVEGLLIKHGVYKASVEAHKKTSKAESEGE